MVHHSEFIRICDPGISLSNVTPPVPHIDQKDSCTQINLCYYASSSGPVRHGKGFYAQLIDLYMIIFQLKRNTFKYEKR